MTCLDGVHKHKRAYVCAVPICCPVHGVAKSQARLSGQESSGPHSQWALELTPLGPVLPSWYCASLKEVLLTRNAVLHTPIGQVALLVKNLPAGTGDTGDPGSIPGLGRYPWRRKRPPSAVFLPGEAHGQRSPVGYSPWGCKESDTTEQNLSTERAHVDTYIRSRAKPYPVCG